MKKFNYHVAFSFILLLIASPAMSQTERLGGFVDGSNQSLSAPLVETINDGSFEAGAFGGTWIENSTNFGTPICDLGSCGTGTGTGPNTGAFWAWFGGIGANEAGSVEQAVVVGATGSATLTFSREQIICDSPDDFLEVLVDGVSRWSTDGSDPLCGVLGYSQVSLNFNDVANLRPITLTFNSEIFAINGAGSNFFIDDVSLDDEVNLPVELVSFTARQSGNQLQFAWTTATEVNNAGFELQHSFDGSEFSAVSFVEGQGNSEIEQNYSYLLSDLEMGAHSFRLKQIDFDGSFEYSKLIETAVTEPNSIWLDEVYPNPFNPSSNIRFMVPSTQDVKVTVYDSFGRQVRTLLDATVQPDLPYNLRFNADDLPSGTYHILVSGRNMHASKTVTLAK